MTNWINVKVELPIKTGEYLLTIVEDGKAISTMGLFEADMEVFAVRGKPSPENELTHWAEFPEPAAIVASLGNSSLAGWIEPTQCWGIKSEDVQKRIDELKGKQ